MKYLFLIQAFLLGYACSGQEKPTIYCLPGQGSDRHIFDSIRFPEEFEIKFIEYDVPGPEMTMASYALHLSKRIDTSHTFYLIGVSIGGMLCIELSEIIHPEKTIIISSAKNRHELPLQYRFQRHFPLYQLFSERALYYGALIAQPVVEPDRRKNKETFVRMLRSKNPTYLRRTIIMIINWDRESNSKKIYHIHGTMDHTIPLRNVKNPDFIINHGSHMMTLTRADEISNCIAKILKP
jgi:hypothetical protein